MLLALQTSQPTLETFQDLLHRHPDAFYLARTAKALQAHWQLMKQYYLLEDQTVQPLPKGDQVLNISDAEELIGDSKLRDMRDDVLEHELTVADWCQKREIQQLEQELQKWQVLIDSITGMSSALQQPDAGSSAGPHGAVPDVPKRDHPRKGNQG